MAIRQESSPTGAWLARSLAGLRWVDGTGSSTPERRHSMDACKDEASEKDPRTHPEAEAVGGEVRLLLGLDPGTGSKHPPG